ncbi:MAG: hydantoinase/oxoprolinase family protein [Planctomycetota bacterium]
MRIGVDTGGTFTDFVFIHRGRLSLLKLPSTPDDPARAILAGLEKRLPLPAGAVLVHGSTVATNAILERKLAKVAFVTNRGLEDLLEIGRQARPELYSLEVRKPAPLVPRNRRLGVAERVASDGTAIETLSRQDLLRLRRRIEKIRPEAIAVGLLFSFLNERGERQVERALRSLGLPISLTADVAPEVREYERFSTTCANAALVPKLTDYLESLEQALPGVKLFVFQSNGGMARVAGAARTPVRLVLSGPAGGAVAVARLAQTAGLKSALALDMGGTSTDVSLIEGAPLRRGEITVDGLPLLVPSLDIQTVGAGGGSIAWVDRAGLLQVGPTSAGSDPGPACYGRSDEPTVTDAHLVLGRLPESLAGAEVTLFADRSHLALERLGKRLGLKAREAAEGVLAVADATMARAARVVAVERGIDPRRLPLVAFGGAGPLHAARLSSALPCSFALVPPLPGNLSAYGMALADAERDLVRSVLIRDPDAERDRVEEALEALVRSGTEELRADGLLEANRPPHVLRLLDCRYAGQTFTLPLQYSRSVRNLAAAFHAAHQDRFGHAFCDRAVEVVHARVRLQVRSRRRNPAQPPAGKVRGAPRSAILEERVVWFSGNSARIPCFDRSALLPGHRIEGPAIIEELSATTVVEPGFSATVDAGENLRLLEERSCAS